MAMSHILIRNQEKEQRKEWELKLRLQNLAQNDRRWQMEQGGSKLKTDHSEGRCLVAMNSNGKEMFLKRQQNKLFLEFGNHHIATRI